MTENAVSIAAHVVAAGVYNDKARFTVVFTPIFDAAGTINLAVWPQAIGALLKKGSAFAADLKLIPLTSATWRPDPLTQPQQNLPVTAFAKPLSPADEARLASYWAEVMGGDQGIKALRASLDPKSGSDPIETVMRKAEDDPQQQTPDFHGTGRSTVAIRQSFNTAGEIVAQVMGDPVLQFDEDLAVYSLSHALDENLRLQKEGKLHSKAALRTESAQAAEITDDKAYTALKNSRVRADAFAHRRVQYQQAASSQDAVKALTRSHIHLLLQGTSPIQLARDNSYFQAKGTRRLVQSDPLPTEELAAFRLASRTPDGSPSAAPLLKEDPAVEFARRRLFTLQANPSLSRLFRFVVDFQCDRSLLEAALTQPQASAQEYGDEVLYDRESSVFPILTKPTKAVLANFLVVSFPNAGARAQIWATAKYRMPAGTEDKGHFLPCTREEIDARAAGYSPSDVRKLAIAEQIDGIVDLGQCVKDESISVPRYDILTLDAITATGAAYNAWQQGFQRAYEIKKSGALPARLARELSELKAATQRGAGLALADRWRQLHAIGRHLESKRQRDLYTDPNNPKSIILDASDLTVGYKLDTGLRLKNDTVDRNRWHTLMHRTVVYTPTKGTSPPRPDGKTLNEYIDSLYPAGARSEADDGQLQVPTSLRDWTPPSGKFSASTLPTEGTTAFTEEIIGAWRGDPLSLACGIQSIALDPQELRINMKYDLPKNSPALTPPPLRFGWQYHFGLRAVFSGGISLPLNRAINHYEYRFEGDMVRPKADIAGHAFRRHERIDAPSISVPDWLFGTLVQQTTHTKVALRGRFPAPQAGQMLLRSFVIANNRKIAQVPDDPAQQDLQPGVGFDRRILLAPAVSLDFATLHGAFRGKSVEFDRDVEMCEPRLLGEEGSEDSEVTFDEQQKLEWVPAPPPQPGKGKPTAAAVWKQARVAWRPSTITSRPRGGLRTIDHRAAWGGLPVYRASASLDPIVVPKIGDEVPPQAAPVTDDGEILHRVKGQGQRVVVKYKDDQGRDQELRRTVLWSAVGALDDGGGKLDLVDRAGTAVFRALPNGRQQDVERQPYYPDPAAVTLAIQVQIGNQPLPPVAIELYRENKLSPVPAEYPHAMPVVLDVVRGDPKDKRITVKARTNYNALPRTASGAVNVSLAVAHVTVVLGPGEEAAISTWCVPSETFLTYMWAQTEAISAKFSADTGADNTVGAIEKAFVDGLQELTGQQPERAPSTGPAAAAPTKFTGLGGLAIPPPDFLATLAKATREELLAGPIPEITAVTTISAVHAIDLPQAAPLLPKEKVRPWALLRADTKTIGDVLDNAQACGPLCQPANWLLENQVVGAIDVLLDGTIAVDGQSTAALEIRARGIAAARGRFDDIERGRSRDDRARGLWPKPDSQNNMDPKRLFGFMPAADASVQFDLEAVTLLRIEGFDSNTQKLDLLDTQRTARAYDKTHDGSKEPVSTPPLRVYRPPGFPDGRARLIEIFAIATARHAAALRTRYDELPEVLQLPAPVTKNSKPEDIKILNRRWLPATIRPARPATLSPIPSFQWTDNVPTPANAKLPSVTMRRSMRVRVRLKRPWFSSGEGERLGVVIWPPNLFESPVEVRNDLIRPAPNDRQQINLRTLQSDGSGVEGLQDADMGPGGSWVSRWGADPIRNHGGVQGWLLSKDNFVDVEKTPYDFERVDQDPISDALLVRNVRMPVPVDSDAQPPGPTPDGSNPPGGFMVVSLVTYAPKFDPEQETWFVDLKLSSCGAVYPFLRLGLVRFQPHAPELLRVSEPVVEWVQLMPERTLTATAKRDGNKVLIEATLEGVMSYPTPGSKDPQISPEQAPQVHFSLLQRRPRQSLELAGAEMIKEMRTQDPNCGSGCMTWKATFAVLKSEFEGQGDNWSIFAEEFDRMRPATYPDEPRYSTFADKNFADTGPRFAARLALDNLAIP